MILRWLAGIVLAVFVLFVLTFGGVVWFAFLAVTLFHAGIEWADLGGQPRLLSALVILLAGLFSIIGAFYALPVLLLLPALTVFSTQKPDFAKRITWIAAGFIWLSIPVSLLYLLRVQPQGGYLILILLAATVFQDTAALYGGMLFGKKPNFCPGLSPNKTIAGFVSGFIATIIVFLIAAHLGLLPIWLALLAAASIGTTGPAGDLMMSALKRRAQLDDTGNIIPGHGGVLDRVDALLINTAVFYTILMLAGLIK